MVKQTADYFEEKARAGDGAFAVAFAILELAAAHRKSGAALDRLGLNYEKSDGPPGAGEAIAMELKRIADALGDR
ncbi:hypothetical protein [Tardiphaga sp. 285_C5_N1_2]|uniref:hypothetical protein n=1 Tax=Tardiphaga sp. 285_C5_N1_2 TaxID=3240775 RepID=UPI003F8AC417